MTATFLATDGGGPSYTLSPVEWRSYIFTFNDSVGREGMPSTPTNRIAIDDGSSNTFPLPQEPAGNWDIATVKIYRSGTGDDRGEHAENPGDEEFYLVDEVPIGTANYTDTKPNIELGEPCWTYDYYFPPQELKNLVASPNGTFLAGSVGKQVFFCEAYELQAWPEKYVLTLDDTIVGLLWSDGGLFVMTDGNPYWVASDPDESGKREVLRLPETISCVSKRSIVKLPNGGACYAHADGLAILQGRQEDIRTMNLWAEDDWESINPETLIAAVYDGFWFGFSDTTAYMFDIKEAVYAQLDGQLITLSLNNSTVNADLSVSMTPIPNPTALHRARTDELFMALPQGISQWDEGINPMQWRWRSRLNVAPGHLNYGGAKIVWEKYPFNGKYKGVDSAVHFKWRTDDRVFYERDVTHSNPYRLPHAARHLDFEVELSGVSEIREFHSATSISELADAGIGQ